MSVDISHDLISEADIRNHLQSIFPDSIFLKNSFKIAAISELVASKLGYDVTELMDRKIDILGDNQSLFQVLKRELSRGFFEDIKLSLKGKTGSLNCKMSGFYMGLFSDINDLIVLRVKFLTEPVRWTPEPDSFRNELDEFVYRTTHDLRGPLATMRGLINLMKFEVDSANKSINELVELLDTHAQKLDERLFNLNYLSGTAQSKTVDDNLDCEALESLLRSTIEENTAINCIDFSFSTPTRFAKVVDSQLTLSMLNHLLLYLINLPMGSDARVSYVFEREERGLRAVISTEGLFSNYQLRQAVSHGDSLYTTIINYANLINFFAAMKGAQRMGAIIHIDFIYERSQQISVVIPASA